MNIFYFIRRNSGTDVTAPIPRTPAKLSAAITEKVQNGEYDLGDLIAPKKFYVASIDNEGCYRNIYSIYETTT